MTVGLDAAVLVDHLTDLVLAEHREAIRAGRRADGGTQAPLSSTSSEGRAAAAGRRPNVRGYTGRTKEPFSDELRRAEIKAGGRARSQSSGTINVLPVPTAARGVIEPSPTHQNWLEEEAARGIFYLYVGGAIARLVAEASGQWLDVATDGALARPDLGRRRAKDARHR